MSAPSLAHQHLPDVARSGAPALRLVTTRPAPRPSAAVYRRRRAVAISGVLLLSALLVVLLWQGGASATLADRVDGHVVVEPGDTLWEIADDHAPADVDTRSYVQQIKALNGVSAEGLAAWSVVLLPAQ